MGIAHLNTNVVILPNIHVFGKSDGPVDGQSTETSLVPYDEKVWG